VAPSLRERLSSSPASRRFVKIRDLEWGDFPMTVENYLALYDEVLEVPDLGVSLFPVRPAMQDEADWFARLFKVAREGTGVAVVAEEGGQVIGLCTVRPLGEQENQHVGSVGILVARGHRGRGVGRALMCAALDQSRAKFEQLHLSVFQTNAPARHLYESLGFREWGIFPNAIKRDGRYYDLVHMSLNLNQEPRSPAS
jgi:RimJ/RimL family protein N-acetyltransferase